MKFAFGEYGGAAITIARSSNHGSRAISRAAQSGTDLGIRSDIVVSGQRSKPVTEAQVMRLPEPNGRH